MKIFAAVMLLVYPIGVPMALFAMLWELRGQLNPANQIEVDVILEREASLLFDRCVWWVAVGRLVP